LNYVLNEEQFKALCDLLLELPAKHSLGCIRILEQVGQEAHQKAQQEQSIEE
jgi:hypothetical protein